MKFFLYPLYPAIFLYPVILTAGHARSYYWIMLYDFWKTSYPRSLLGAKSLLLAFAIRRVCRMLGGGKGRIVRFLIKNKNMPHFAFTLGETFSNILRYVTCTGGYIEPTLCTCICGEHLSFSFVISQP